MKLKTIIINISFVLILALAMICFTSCNTTQERNSSSSTETISVSTSEETSIESENIIVSEPVEVISEVPETLYDTLTPEEINLVEVTVQHEVGNFSKRYKTYVAEIIYNRLVSDHFPDTIHDVLFQQGQFQGIASWSKSGIIADDETKQAVKEVFSEENPTHNCTFYYNPELSGNESVEWFENASTINYVFSYTERSWGIEYTTRFFEIKENENDKY